MGQASSAGVGGCTLPRSQMPPGAGSRLGLVLAPPLPRMLQLCLSPASSPQINLVQCGVTPTTPARPGKVRELWEDWTLRPMENGRRRSQVGRWREGGRWRGGSLSARGCQGPGLSCL